MRGVALVIMLTLGGCAASPCPDGQARDNGGACVAIADPPPPPGFVPVEDIPPPPPGFEPVPAKDEYVADQEAIAAYNREQLERRAEEDARHEAQWRADRRADRIVEAQEATQRELKRVADKLD